MQEATETLQGPATQPNPWRTRQKKKKRSRCPPICFESAESEAEALSNTCVPLSRAQAKLQPCENCQTEHTITDDLKPRPIILYGVPQSFDASPASNVQHNIAQLQKMFSGVLPSDQHVSICKAFREGSYTSSSAETPRPLKVIFGIIAQQRLLMSRKVDIAERNPTVFSIVTIPRWSR